MKVSFIGGGVMGEAMIRALIRHNIGPGAIQVGEIDPERVKFLSETYEVRCFSNNVEAIVGSEVVILSVKPSSLTEVASEVRGKLDPGQLLLSIIAGASLKTLQESTGHQAVVRAMPNTPAQIGEGMTVWTASPAVGENQRRLARAILTTLGKEIYVEDEKHLDMATALSGSGPAYFFLFLEALTDAGVCVGLPREIARELALQTGYGAMRLCRESGKSPAELRNMVTSPGGTTAAALLQLEEAGFRGVVARAVMAAYEKSKLLGQGAG